MVNSTLVGPPGDPPAPLKTGPWPAQLVSADLSGDGWDDLIVRNSGDGTLTVFFSNGSEGDATGNALFPSSVIRPVGLGVSDVALVNTTGSRLPDIVVTNKLTGLVSVLRNLGGGNFGTPVLYRAGVGLLASDKSGSVTSMEATVDVAAGAFTTGAPTDLLTVNTGSNTLGLLAGLGGGRFANPVNIPTAEPAQVVRVDYFNHDRIPDVAVLGQDTVSIYLGNGRGGFSAPVSYNAGLDPTGLTVADVNGDGHPDLVIGNTFGDVLVLAGQGDGTFRPLLDTSRNIALAVADLNGDGKDDFVFTNQALDRVSVKFGGARPTVFQKRTDSLLAPGAVVLDDLNGDGKKDLVVANSGSNNVLIYPGLGNGQFGPAVNGGHGFSTGTDPVGITVADVNGDRKPDLVVANKGSNAVSILLNQSQGNSITFAPGPRLKAGSGPLSTVVKDVTGDGIPDLLVSNSQSNNVMLLPGVGGGFFNDQNPRIIALPTSPGPMYPFGPGVVVLNPGSST